MAVFNRFDICEAYWLLEYDWNMGGWLQERPSNVRRMESIGVQLSRIKFSPAVNLRWETLEENGQEIYMEAARRFGLPITHSNRSCRFYVEGERFDHALPSCPDCCAKKEAADSVCRVARNASER